MQQFIGVTGIQNHIQLNKLLSCITELQEKNFRLRLGYIFTDAYFDSGEMHRRGISLEEMRKCVSQNLGSLAQHVMHFSCDDDPAKTIAHLDCFFSQPEFHKVDVLQLNELYPQYEKQILSEIHNHHPNLEIIYVLNKHHLIQSGDEICARLMDVIPFISDILLDVSGGKGIEFVPNNFSNLIVRLKEYGEQFNVGLNFTGGFSPTNVGEKILHLRDLGLNHFGVDAESMLRESNDTFSAEKAALYITNTVSAFKKRSVSR